MNNKELEYILRKKRSQKSIKVAEPSASKSKILLENETAEKFEKMQEKMRQREEQLAKRLELVKQKVAEKKELNKLRFEDREENYKRIQRLQV